MSVEVLPRGKIAVTPVRTGPWPTTSLPAPAISVRCPTSTPATSVIASSGPGVPVNGMPSARARTAGSPGRVSVPAPGRAGTGDPDGDGDDPGPRAGPQCSETRRAHRIRPHRRIAVATLLRPGPHDEMVPP